MKKKKPQPKKVSYTQLRDPSFGHSLQIWTYGGQYHGTPATMPNEITVLGMKYRIYYHSKIYAEKKKTTRLCGIVSYAHRIIYIDPGQTIHMMREALYHEICHVYIHVSQTKSEALRKLTYQQVEDICDMLGEAIPDLTSNNTICT